MSDDRTKAERVSDREMVVTRSFDGPARLVFKAWTTPELFKRWWAPKSMGANILICEMDVRTGGGYRLAFGDDPAEAFEFFGRYLEVVPNERLVWTNEEEENGAVTTVTFEERDGTTLLTMIERYPDEAVAGEDGFEFGQLGALPEQFGQLDALLDELA